MNKLKRWEIESHRDSFLKENEGRDTIFNLQSIEKNYYEDGLTSNVSEDFKKVKTFDLNLSDKEVFTDDHDGSIHRGLKNSQLKFIDGKPVYLIDNHNKALYPFFEIFNLVDEKLTVVHIDAHRDDAIFPKDVEQIAFGNLQKYLDETRVSDYLDVSTRGGLVNEIISITQSSEFEECEIPDEPYVLNLDIDIYGPEGSYVDTKLKTEVILKAWQNAEAVIFATSPGFILNEDVEDLTDIFLN